MVLFRRACAGMAVETARPRHAVHAYGNRREAMNAPGSRKNWLSTALLIFTTQQEADMSIQNPLDRRDFLRLAGLGAAAWAAGRMDVLAPADAATSTGRVLLARRSPAPDFELVLRAVPSSVRLFSGTPTRVWTYQASLVRGRPGNLQTLPNSYLGPIVRVRRGQKVRVHFVNLLPGKSIIHWHGLRVPPAMDGHPRDAVAPGRWPGRGYAPLPPAPAERLQLPDLQAGLERRHAAESDRQRRRAAAGRILSW
jgi:hypothetical protein